MGPDILMLAPLLEEYEELLAKTCSLSRAYTVAEQLALLDDCPERFKVVVTNGGHGVDPQVLARLPELGLIAVNGVGLDRIDLEETRRRAISVVTTPDVLTDAVADLAVGLTLAVLRQIVVADRFVRSGEWELRPFKHLGTNLRGQRVGILGLGRIGSAIAQRLIPFGAQLAYHNRQPVEGCDFPYCNSLEQLALQSDILIIAAAGGPQSRHLVSRHVLGALGETGVVINVARGSVVDQTALTDLLLEGRLAGAGLDVFEEEPKVPATLLGLDNVVVQPHLGSATIQTRQAMAQIVVDAVLGFCETPA
ncbi:2-hydroxyacid dehydrogenase [Pseudomonas sp.]|uniref:2-hydroxyacid dehydrogenase n=1 Tax=Pseudomonas sp. TaxID=306 RepID=UPI00299EB9A6|nr:2-hydroxyacid dehydrogenase [Pseudomonas sp.]MDX1366700.1 2-hydroxyacid dehydrogenase [Pseudomonas sp.]